MNQNQIAINSITLKQAAFEEAMDAIAGAGFKQVEFHIPLVKDWLKNRRTVRDARAFLDKRGLRCIGGFETHCVVFGDDKMRKENHALLIANSQLLAQLSVGKSVMVVGTDGPARPGIDDLAKIGKTLRELADQFAPSVSIALEFNWSPVVKSVRSAAIAIKAANHPRVGMLFDSAHYHCTTSKLEDLTEGVVRKIIHVHVNDMRDKPGEHSHCNSDRVLPGEGTLDLTQLLGRLHQYGYRGAYAIELFNDDIWKMPATQAAKLCYGAMKRLCGKS